MRAQRPLAYAHKHMFVFMLMLTSCRTKTTRRTGRSTSWQRHCTAL